MDILRFRSIFSRFLVVFLSFVFVTSVFLPPQVFALSPEKRKEAQDYANRISAEAIKSIEPQKAYNIGEIISVVILNLVFLAVLSLITRKLRKYKLGRILYLPIILLCVLFFYVSLFIYGFLHTPKLQYSPPLIPVHYSTP